MATMVSEVEEKMRRAHCLNNEAKEIMRGVAESGHVSEEIGVRIRKVVDAMDIDDAEINTIRNQL